MNTYPCVTAVIPHRPPMLLVDEICAFEAEKEITCRLTLHEDKPFFSGHFPDYPIWPGVMTVEALAQSAAALVNLTQQKTAEESLFIFMALEQVKFRNPAFPGDTLNLHVTLQQQRGSVYKFDAQAKVHDKVIVTALFTAKWQQKE